MKKFLFGKIIFFFLVISTFVIHYSCSDPVTGVVENQPPQSYIYLFPDSVIAPGSTVKTIYWWGDDPDGFVKGYNISFDSVNWIFTTSSDSTFTFTINGDDSTFNFYVAAVDDKELVDPTPASNLFPVQNTPPSMEFESGTEIPETTFTVATFKWTGTDPDGDNNIKYYYWALNDTNNFKQVTSDINLFTLTKDSGLIVNSNNVLYMKAQDKAGAFSNIVRMPEEGKSWYVKEVTASVLLILDTPIGDISTATSFYESAFDTIDYQILDIKSNDGALIPKIVNPMFIETMKLFKAVVWTANRGNSDADNANFDLAQNSLPYYIQDGGKVFFTTGFPNAETQTQGDLINFMPVDSISYCTISILSSSVDVLNIDSSYPLLKQSSTISRVRGIETSTAHIIYKLPVSTSCDDSIVVGIKDVTSNPKSILLGLPLYKLNGDPESVKALLNKILISEFSIY